MPTCIGYDIQEKFNKICSGLQINEKMLNQNYNDLSGGEKTIVNLGALLLKEPSILLLDEPTNSLDEKGVETVRKLFLQLKKEGITILIASHNMEDIYCLCDKVYRLTDGVLKEECIL